MSKFPPKDKNEFMDWVATRGDQAKCADKLRTVLEYMRSKGQVDAVGVSGHCWGSSVSLSMAGVP
jgi:dienelactone hydrolase